MPRPKNYAFEKAQRERARLARKAARKDARLKPDGTPETDADAGDAGDAESAAEADTAKDTDPERG